MGTSVGSCVFWYFAAGQRGEPRVLKMSRFSQSARFMKNVDPDQTVSKSFEEMGLIRKEPRGVVMAKPMKNLERDLILHGNLDGQGYFAKEETSTLEAAIGPLS